MRPRFGKADSDGSGSVEWEEFESALQDFRVQICFKNLGCLDRLAIHLDLSRDVLSFLSRKRRALSWSSGADC